METTHYVPKADEPSPFVIDNSFPQNIEWNIWRRAQSTGFYDFLAAEVDRLKLIQLLEHEPARSPESLAALPRVKDTWGVSLVELIIAKYERDLPWMTAYRLVMKEKPQRSKEGTAMEQKDTPKCDFREMVDYLTNPDNVWNPEKYIPNRTLHGHSFGQESQIRFQYVRGAAYAEGYIGNWKFELYFSNLQGWQLHWTGTLDEGKFEDPQIQAFTPDAIISLMFIIGERVAPRRSPTPPIRLDIKE